MKCFAFACALIALTACAETGAKAKVDVETSKTFDMRRPRAEDYTSGPKPSRRVRAVLWGVTHNHALGKFEAMKKLKELAEIVRGERPNPQELYDHDLRVHRLSLQACNIPLAEGKNPVAVDAFESGGHRIVASDKGLDVR